MARNAGSIGQAEINRVHDVTGRVMSWNRIPDDVLKWLAIFNKHMALLSCLPTVRNGNCYQSQKFYSVESIKVDGRPIKAQFTVCKSPLKIIFRYQIPSNPTWARLLLGIDAEPIVILFDTRKDEGVTKIDSSATAKVRLLGLGSSKLTLKINGLLRWDCTKPRNFLQRLRYNTEYEDRRSGDSFNKIYYKLRVCFEFKMNKLSRFCSRDGKCEDLINVQGDLGEGSQRCNKEVTNAMQWLYNGNPTRGMKVFDENSPSLSFVLWSPETIVWLKESICFTL